MKESDVIIGNLYRVDRFNPIVKVEEIKHDVVNKTSLRKETIVKCVLFVPINDLFEKR